MNNQFLIHSLPKGWIYTHYEALIHLLLLEEISMSTLSQKNFKIQSDVKNLINFSTLSSLIDFLSAHNLQREHILQPLDQLKLHD